MDNNKIEVPNADVHKHLDLLQGIISRMAANSASCKNYCVTLSVGLLALDQIKEYKMLTFLAFVPILAFAILDAYYLYLETHFRKQYDVFVQKWQIDKLTKTDLFIFGKPEAGFKAFKDSLYQFWSLSVGMFYGFLLLIMAVLVYFLAK